jgi:uncharacterized membrane protein HdeD (DUF308 family)
MEKLKSLKWNYIIEALITVAIGIALIIRPQGSLEIMAKALAVLLTLAGIVMIISYFVYKERSILISGGLALGIAIAAIGVWIFLNPSPFIDFVPRLFGVFIIASGLTNLSQTLSLIRYKYGLWWLSLIFGILTIVFGVVLLVNPKFVENILVTLIGLFLVFDGVTNIWTVSRVSKFARGVDQVIRDSEAIDVDAQIVDSRDNPER